MARPAPLDGGVTRPGEGRRWHIMGQTYVERAFCDACFVFETTLAAGQLVPVMIHDRQDKFLMPLDGPIRLRLGRDWHLAGAGDLIRVPRGRAHGYFNDTDHQMRVLTWVSPAGTLRELFDALALSDDMRRSRQLALNHGVRFPPPAEQE